MPFEKIEREIELCEKHLEETASKGTEIDSILAKYLLVYICACYESEFKNIMIKRTASLNDENSKSFVHSLMRRLRVLKLRDIKQNLKKFNRNYPKEFDKRVQDPRIITAYGNIITNRHSFAHGSPIQMPFDEVVDSYKKSKIVLTAFSDVLGSHQPNSVV